MSDETKEMAESIEETKGTVNSTEETKELRAEEIDIPNEPNPKAEQIGVEPIIKGKSIKIKDKNQGYICQQPGSISSGLY